MTARGSLCEGDKWADFDKVWVLWHLRRCCGWCRVKRDDGKSHAVKVILLEKTREDKSQIKTLGEVNHPGIIKLVDWFETPST